MFAIDPPNLQFYKTWSLGHGKILVLFALLFGSVVSSYISALCVAHHNQLWNDSQCLHLFERGK